MPQYGGSAGCFGPMSDFNVGNYTSGNVGTSKYTGTGEKLNTSSSGYSIILKLWVQF